MNRVCGMMPSQHQRQDKVYITTDCCPSWTPHYVSAMLGFVSFSLVACLTPIIENILRRKQIYIICSLSKDENIYIFLHKEEQFQNKQKTCYQTKYTLPRIYRDRRKKNVSTWTLLTMTPTTTVATQRKGPWRHAYFRMRTQIGG